MLRKLIAEGLGTFFLVLVGCGVAVIAGHSVGLLGVAMAFGLTLTIMVYSIGPISGCHLNPAISLAMVCSRKISLQEFIGYGIVQVAAACVAGYVLLTILQGNPDFNLSEAGLASNGFEEYSPAHFSMISGMITEIIATFLFTFVVLSTTRKSFPTEFGGLVIGIALMVGLLLAGNVTNGSLNPARSIGVAVVQGGWATKHLWFFIIMPCIGSFLAFFAHKGLKTE